MKDLQLVTKSEQKTYINSEIVRTVYKQLLGVIVICSLGGPMTAFIFVPFIDLSIILSWLALQTIFCVIAPAILRYYYKKSSPDDLSLNKWAKLFVILAFFGGSTWGFIGYIFFIPDNLIYQLILFFFLFTASASAMATTSIFSSAFYAVVFPMLLPIAFISAMEGDSLHIVFALATIIYLFSLVFFHLNIHTTLMRSLALQLENLNMAKNLEKKNYEIELASNAKSRFLAAASHDLRQPLHAQSLFVAELQAKISDPALSTTLQLMKNSVDVMRDLFDALLDISRLDVGMIDPHLTNFDVSQTLFKLKNEFLPQMQDKGLRFRVVSKPNLILSDRRLLERITRNLLSNALTYTDTGSVLVCARKRNNMLHIEVRDSGIGIPDHLLNTIFDEFSQLNNPERDRNKGLGLGLTIVDRLCKLLGHEITVKSSIDSGSTFTIITPLGNELLIDTENDEEVQMSLGHNLNMSVLVIDDDKTILTAMHGILTHWGCEVFSASSADEAVQLLSKQKIIPDALVADFRLRDEETGIQAIQQVCNYLSKDIPALLITGDTAKERLQEAKESKYDLLHKPVNPEKLFNWLYNNGSASAVE